MNNNEMEIIIRTQLMKKFPFDSTIIETHLPQEIQADAKVEYFEEYMSWIDSKVSEIICNI